MLIAITIVIIIKKVGIYCRLHESSQTERSRLQDHLNPLGFDLTQKKSTNEAFEIIL